MPPAAHDTVKFPQSAGLKQAAAQNAALPRDIAPFLRVRQRLQQWKEISANDTLLEIIQCGLKLPMHSFPRPSAGRTRGPVEGELKRLHDLGVLRRMTQEEVRRTTSWTPTFAVPKKDSLKIRLITDLRELNSCATTPKFRMPAWKDVLALAGQARGQWACKLDLEEYFFHLGLHESCSRWIRVAPHWEMRALPFGLECSPYWSSRLSRPVLQYLQDLQVQLIWYVDDLLVIAKTPDKLRRDMTVVIDTMTALGFAVNARKSVIEPTQVIEYLGLVLNLREDKVELSTNKLHELRRETAKLLNRNQCSAKSLASLAGRLQYYEKGHATLVGWPRSLMNLAGVASSRKGWTKTSSLSEPTKKILQTILSVLQDKAPVRIPHPAEEFVGTLFTDASNSGWGAVFCPSMNSTSSKKNATTTLPAETQAMARDPTQLPAQQSSKFLTTTKERAYPPLSTAPQSPAARYEFSGRWTNRQSALHITTQETLAVVYTINALSRSYNVSGRRILIKTDSVAARAAVSKGSKYFGLNWAGAAARKAANLEVVIEHTPGVSNPADSPSRRSRDREDFKLLPKWVKRACKAFGRPLPKVDLFAGRHNTSAPAYFASHEDGGSGLLGVNALAHPWQELKDPYANPPWSLMADVIHKVIRDKVKSIIVVAPVWRGATWWPLLNRLTTKSYNIPQNEAVFSTELQSALPPPKWRTTVRLLAATQTP